VLFLLLTIDPASGSFPYRDLGSWTRFGEDSANFIFPGDPTGAGGLPAERFPNSTGPQGLLLQARQSVENRDPKNHKSSGQQSKGCAPCSGDGTSPDAHAGKCHGLG
jgi:hypothetical protein